MNKIKSVVLNKTRYQDGYVVEFYNPWWGRFAVEYKHEGNKPALNNMIHAMRVGDYYLVYGKSLMPDAEIKEYEIIKYMVEETEQARKSQRELAIPNMNVMEIDALADKILQEIKNYQHYNYIKTQKVE